MDADKWSSQHQQQMLNGNRKEKYRPIKEIGEGAYGKVWSARKCATGEEFALKEIMIRNAEEGVPQSVIREVATLKMLSHPNIVRLHEAFVRPKDGTICLYIVTEKCDWDLFVFLRDIPRDMGNHQCRHFAKQLLKGIDFLHCNNIIHRDIKPQNILVNEDQTLKIADFGLSRNYGLHTTFTTEVVTLWYRSPELLLQCKYNTSVDVWSAGCIIIELYTREPFIGENTEARQLTAIFQKLGTPSKSNWPHDAVIARQSYPDYEPQPLYLLIPKVNQLDQNALDLISLILRFDPHHRPTAAECLRHAYFS